MKKTLLFFSAIAIFILASCSKEARMAARFEKETTNILEHIPKNTKGVMIFNLPDMIEKLQEGSGDDFSQMIEDAVGSQIYNKLEPWVDKKTPIDFSKPAALFEMNDEAVFTFFIRNEKDFRELLEDETDVKLKERNGVWAASNDQVFQIGKQVWFTSSSTAFKPADFSKLKDLDKDRSFAALDVSQNIIEHHSDLSLIVDISEFSKLNYEFEQYYSQLNIVVSNPTYFEGYVDFEEGAITGQLALLDKKGMPSKLSVPLEKIDLSTFKQLPGKGNFFFAAGVNANALKPIIDNFRDQMPEGVGRILQSINGTIAFSTDYKPDGFNGVFGTMNGTTANSLKDFFAEYFEYNNVGTISTDGNKILVSNPQNSGVEAREVADKFEGAVAGVAASSKNLGIPELNKYSSYFTGASAVLKTEDKSLVFEFTIDTEEGQNSLVTLFDFISKARQDPNLW